MTLLTETNSNSMVAKYDGDIVNIIAEKDDGDSKKIYITQLSRDDIKNMIAQRSNEKPLEERLKSDYKCRYNFRRPTIHQHRGYAKQLLNSLKDMDLIMPSPIKKGKLLDVVKVSFLQKLAHVGEGNEENDENPRNVNNKEEVNHQKL